MPKTKGEKQLTKDLFFKLYHDAKNRPNCELYIAEYGYPDYFDDISNDATEVVRQLTEIHKLAHMTVKEMIAAAGMSQTTFAKYFDIPLRTVQEWCGGRRQMPEYLKLMAAEILGLLPNILIDKMMIDMKGINSITNSTVKTYSDICKAFSHDSSGWSNLPFSSFFTTDGSGWKETSDNAHGGIDVSWAFGLSDEAIEHSAAERLFELLMQELQVAVDDDWDSEQLAAALENFNL